MALEGPAINVIVARLADPKIHLAAYGSFVFPLALFIEAPIVMLLAASTALSVDRLSYRRIRRFMHVTSGVLTALHLLVAATPLYDIVVRGALGAPEEIAGAARIGLLVMLPWTWAIAYRRFNQGVLIRFGHTKTVGIGTIIRLSADCAILAVGYGLSHIPGTTIAAAAVSAGVVAEAIYAGFRVRPVLCRLPEVDPEAEPLTVRTFLRFYVPLSLTSIVFLGARPLFSAAMTRMPDSLDSLAAWPVVGGLVFLFRSVGQAYSEVTIAHLRHRGSFHALRRFTVGLMAVTSVGFLLASATPLARVWFGTITGLTADLIGFARSGAWFALLLPAISAAQSYYQGVVLHSRRTRSITEAILIYFAVTGAALVAGIAWGGASGIHVSFAAMSLGEVARVVWLWWRSRAPRAALRARDAADVV